MAEFKDKEAAILFPTGYSANVGFISAIMRSGDHIFCDQYSHASIVDGAILAKSKTVFFRHNNPMDLERKLSGVRGKKLVVVEGVYSMDGDVCLLPEIVDVAKRHGARILIDEAHSTFLFGPTAAACPSTSAWTTRWTSTSGTFSKSLGRPGRLRGRLEGPDRLHHGLRPLALLLLQPGPRPWPPAAAGVRIVDERAGSCGARLWSNVAFLRRRFAEEGIDIGKSTSQVMPVMVNNDAKVFAVAEKIQQGGLFLQPVTYPAVPKHKSRLRISVSAAHSEQELEFAVGVIARVLREEGICRA
jgi:glycine C-acetyltransferase